MAELAGGLELQDVEPENLAGQDTGRDHLSHSSISLQLNCLRKYGWHAVERLELLERPRPLGMGAAFAKALETGDPELAAHELRVGTQILNQDDENRLRIEEATIDAASSLYLDTFGTPEQREVEYRVRLRSPWTGAPSRTFDLLGYADGLSTDDRGHELIEDKFVGKIDSVSIRKLPLDRQVSLACYGLWRATGKKVRVVHYRFIRKPSIKQRQNETLDEFLDRLRGDYFERPDFYCVEESLFRSDDDLALIEAELWDWAEQRRNARQRNFYSRNSSHCSDYGGCPFIPLCVGDPDAHSLYRERPVHELEQEAKAK